MTNKNCNMLHTIGNVWLQRQKMLGKGSRRLQWIPLVRYPSFCASGWCRALPFATLIKWHLSCVLCVLLFFFTSSNSCLNANRHSFFFSRVRPRWPSFRPRKTDSKMGKIFVVEHFASYLSSLDGLNISIASYLCKAIYIHNVEILSYDERELLVNRENSASRQSLHLPITCTVWSVYSFHYIPLSVTWIAIVSISDVNLNKEWNHK